MQQGFNNNFYYVEVDKQSDTHNVIQLHVEFFENKWKTTSTLVFTAQTGTIVSMEIDTLSKTAGIDSFWARNETLVLNKFVHN